MTSLANTQQALRDAAREAHHAAGGSKPVMRMALNRASQTLDTAADRLWQAANCGIGPDGDITLALTLATAHAEHRRGDVKAALDKLMEAFAYIQQQERQSA